MKQKNKNGKKNRPQKEKNATPIEKQKKNTAHKSGGLCVKKHGQGVY